jgi:hypothetical protein
MICVILFVMMFDGLDCLVPAYGAVVRIPNA